MNYIHPSVKDCVGYKALGVSDTFTVQADTNRESVSGRVTCKVIGLPRRLFLEVLQVFELPQSTSHLCLAFTVLLTYCALGVHVCAYLYV